MTLSHAKERLDSLQQSVQALHVDQPLMPSGGRRTQSKASYGTSKVKGTRPSSDRGVTFHMKHAFVSKGRDISSSALDHTPAAKHQAYIERPGAVDRPDGWEIPPEIMQRAIQPLPLSGRSEHYPLLKEAYWPEPHAAPGALSFGTLGQSKTDRQNFWRLVEEEEGKRGRVQCRIILEMPHEASQQTRFQIAREFCRVLEDRGLPYWAAMHAPYGRNDPRNHHLHVAYHDRPTQKFADGEWDFQAKIVQTDPNRRKRLIRPWRQDKDRECQGKAWIVQLRKHYADVANFHLSLDGVRKRYDPRPYEESGVDKQPTEHLGTRAAVAESHGVATRIGQANTGKETQFRLDRGQQGVTRATRWGQQAKVRIDALLEQQPTAVLRALDQSLQQYYHQTTLWAQATNRSETHKLAAEAVGVRVEERMAFLEQEGKRLLTRPRVGEESTAWAAAARLLQERGMAKQTKETNQTFVSQCQKIAKDADTAARNALVDIYRLRRDIQERLQRAEANRLASTQRTPTETPEERAIRSLLGEGAKPRAVPAYDSILDGVRIPAHQSPQERAEQTRNLSILSNRDLRRRARSTQGMIDQVDDYETRGEFQSGYDLCKVIAQQRGLDLDSGLQTEAEATDKVQAKRHQDDAMTEEERRRSDMRARLIKARPVVGKEDNAR